MYTYFIDITSLFLVKGDILGTCKVRNEMKGNQTKQNETNWNETKPKIKRNETSETKQTELNKTKN